MINIASCLSLLLIYSGTSWSYSAVLSTPWLITIETEPDNSSFNSCIGVLTSETEVLAPSECINQLPADSQFVLKAGKYYQQTRLIQSVWPTYNVAKITVNSFELNTGIQTLQVEPVTLCSMLKIRDAYTFIKQEPFNGYTITNLNFSNSNAVCNELSDRRMVNPLLHTCTRLSDDDCSLSKQRGGEVLVIKSDGSFKLAGFKFLHDCERKVAVYTKICRWF